MICFEDLFIEAESDEILYNSKRLVLRDKLKLSKGSNLFKIRFKEANSKFDQGFILSTKGQFIHDNQEVIENKVVYWEKTAPAKFDIKVQSDNKELLVYNVWKDVDGVIQFGHNGAAMYIVKDGENRIYYCNDGYPDDDLNDLVFSITILG